MGKNSGQNGELNPIRPDGGCQLQAGTGHGRTRPTRRRASSTQLSEQTVAGCRSDRLLNSGDGSELFITDRWSLEQSSPGHAPGDDDGTCVCGFHSIGHVSAHC